MSSREREEMEKGRLDEEEIRIHRRGSKQKRGLDEDERMHERMRKKKHSKEEEAQSKGEYKRGAGERVGVEMKRRWGGDESSPGYQPRWAGLLCGWLCDTCAETHTHRGLLAVTLLRSLLLLWRRVEDRDATGTHSS